MPQIDSYTAGTVTLTNGSAVVNGVGTNWMSGTANYSILAGHLFVCGSFFAPVSSVTAAGQLTLAIPYTGATASGLAYRIFRYTWVETPAVAGFLQALMDRGTKTKPVTRWDLDSGAMSMTFRQDDAGNPALFVGSVGAADGSMVKSLAFDKSTGNVSTTTGKVGIGTSGTTINYNLDVRGTIGAGGYWMGTAYPDAWIGGIAALDGDSTHKFLHIGGATSTDGHRRISLQGSLVTTTARVRIGGETPAAASLHTVAHDGLAALRTEASAGAPFLQMIKSDGNFNQKIWDINPSNSGAVLSIRAMSDDYLSGTSIIDIARSGSDSAGIIVTGVISPSLHNTYDLGIASRSFHTIFAGTPTISSSDATLKDVRGEPGEAELDAWGHIRAKIYRFLDAIAAKGDDARLHTGWVAQEIAAAFEAEGLDPRRYALFCADLITEKVSTTVPGKVPVFDDVEETHLEIEIIDGVPRQAPKTHTTRRQRFDQVPVIGVDGEPVTEWRPDPQGDVERDGVKGRVVPVTHPVPVMVDGEVEQTIESPPVERLGLRYEECLVLENAWARREMARLHHAITGLTVRVEALEPAAA